MMLGSGDIIPHNAAEQVIFDYQLTAPEARGRYKDFATGRQDHKIPTAIALQEDGRSQGNQEEIRYLVHLMFYHFRSESTYIWVIPDNQHPGKWLISGDKFR